MLVNLEEILLVERGRSNDRSPLLLLFSKQFSRFDLPLPRIQAQQKGYFSSMVCCPLVRPPEKTPYWSGFLLFRNLSNQKHSRCWNIFPVEKTWGIAGMYQAIGILEKSGRSKERGTTRGQDWTWLDHGCVDPIFATGIDMVEVKPPKILTGNQLKWNQLLIVVFSFKAFCLGWYA